MITWRELVAEVAGTALLMLAGLTGVVLVFSPGSPVGDVVTEPALRRLVAGIIFAGSATLIVYSPLGRISGGHINPAVTLAFWRLGKLTPRSAGSYVAAQVVGAVLGTLVVAAAWGGRARAVRLGATTPHLGGTPAAFVAELVMTGTLVLLILLLVDSPRLMRWTAAAAGALVATFVVTLAPVSGTSLNPARSLAPALVGGTWTALWVYLVAPPAGALLVAAAVRHRRGTVACGKLLHDDGHPCRFLDCEYTPPEARTHRPGRTPVLEVTP